MASRLPLIVSQPANRDAVATDLVENIVAAAMVVPGLDANLISAIETLQSDATDWLCLQGLGNDVVLAGFIELVQAAEAWHRLGFSGTFVNLKQSARELAATASSLSSKRRIYYYQLHNAADVSKLLDLCIQLQNAQQTPLVSIQFGSKPATGLNPKSASIAATVTPNPSESTTASSTPTHRQHNAYDHTSHQHSLAAEGNGKPVNPDQKPRYSSTSESEADDEDWSAIDKLVDDLDALDI